MKAIVKKSISKSNKNNDNIKPTYAPPAEYMELTDEEIMKEFSVYPPCLQNEPNEKVVHDPIIMDEVSSYEENISFSEKQSVKVGDDSAVTFASDKESSSDDTVVAVDDPKCQNGLPDICCFDNVIKYGVGEHRPVIIDGIIRKHQNLLITGSSKAGKSFLLRQLGLAVASGTSWLGRECKQGKVLYIDFELDRISFEERLLDAAKAMNVTEQTNGKMYYLNLKGYNINVNSLEENIVAMVKEKLPDISLIIIDPIYMIDYGEENLASDVTNLIKAFNSISEKTGAAIVYCHHHAKGSSNTKSVIDRGSGSGAFARSADAIIDVSEYAAKEGKKILRVETVLREFKSPDPYYILFEYPLYKVIDNETAKEFKGSSSATKSSSPKTSPEKYKNKILISFNKLRSPEGTCSLNDILKDTGIGSATTVRKYLGECGLKISSGKVSVA